MVIIYTLLFSVSRPLADQHDDGFPAYLPLRRRGLKLAAALRNDTSLVSIMHVNNEIGVIQDIAAIGELAAFIWNVAGAPPNSTGAPGRMICAIVMPVSTSTQ